MHNDGIVYSLCNELDEGYFKKYAEILEFKVTASRIKGNQIVEYKSYQGVRPRFNLNEIKKREKLREKKNGKKKERSKTGR